MKKLLGLAVLLLSIAAATPASAQSFGEIFPVTNTRYGTASGTPRLAANGRDFFLFWSSERKIRATSLAQDEARVGHVVLDTSGPFDVAWTGEVFLAASSRQLVSHLTNANVIGRVLDAEGRPLGGERILVEHGKDPRLAAGPESILMLYTGTAAGETRALMLGRRGEDIGAESWPVPQAGRYYAIGSNDAGFVIAISNDRELRTITLDRQGRTVSERALPRPATSPFRQVALATDGTRYLMVWTDDFNEVAATIIDQNGSFRPPKVIERGRVGVAAAAWNGTGWSISYTSPLDSNPRARVAQLDSSAQWIMAVDQSGVPGAGIASLAAVDGRVMTALTSDRGITSVVQLPLAANEPRPATYAATQQTLLTTTSSADATLIVWKEVGGGVSIRAGLRTNDGQWTERELTTTGDEAVAASDGEQFVVLVQSSKGQELIRLDRRGRPISPGVTLPGSRAAVAWNGTHYGIVTDMNGMLLSPTGALSAPVAIPRDTAGSFSGRIALASNGNGFLLAGETADCFFGVCNYDGLKAMRLSAGLQRIDTEEILDDEYGILAGAVWNGSEYLVAWRASYTGIHTARMPASPGSPATIARPLTDITATSVASMPDGTIAVAGISNPFTNLSRGRVAVLRSDGSIAQTFDVDSSNIAGRPLLTKVPGGVAYVDSSLQDVAPHHGTSHVMMAIARPSVIPPPAAPRVTARLKDGFVLVDWSAPAGTLNGYRLEYRVDGGSWNELEEWFSPGSHHRTIQPSFGTEFEIRMRAFNDGGASPYSETALTKPIRRRAATH